jgi:hypothetical protein
MKDGVMQRHWESADSRNKTVEIVLLRSKVKGVLAELH